MMKVSIITININIIIINNITKDLNYNPSTKNYIIRQSPLLPFELRITFSVVVTKIRTILDCCYVNLKCVYI